MEQVREYHTNGLGLGGFVQLLNKSLHNASFGTLASYQVMNIRNESWEHGWVHLKIHPNPVFPHMLLLEAREISLTMEGAMLACAHAVLRNVCAVFRVSFSCTKYRHLPLEDSLGKHHYPVDQLTYPHNDPVAKTTGEYLRCADHLMNLQKDSCEYLSTGSCQCGSHSL
uniref:Uncharacterized protein n=1 Tax=Arundo donax TaxID=35708 RepID=A0A0A9HKS0_ARUDO